MRQDLLHRKFFWKTKKPGRMVPTAAAFACLYSHEGRSL
jgi:hypothetical protein